MIKEHKYCPYCGEKLQYSIITDENSEKICKISKLICKRPYKL